MLYKYFSSNSLSGFCGKGTFLLILLKANLFPGREKGKKEKQNFLMPFRGGSNFASETRPKKEELFFNFFVNF
jgi:hypothetical protein